MRVLSGQVETRMGNVKRIAYEIAKVFREDLDPAFQLDHARDIKDVNEVCVWQMTRAYNGRER